MELEEMLKAISEKLNINIVSIEEIGDGSVYLVPDKIRISKYDLDLYCKNYLIKHNDRV